MMCFVRMKNCKWWLNILILLNKLLFICMMKKLKVLLVNWRRFLRELILWKKIWKSWGRSLLWNKRSLKKILWSFGMLMNDFLRNMVWLCIVLRILLIVRDKWGFFCNRELMSCYKNWVVRKWDWKEMLRLWVLKNNSLRMSLRLR